MNEKLKKTSFYIGIPAVFSGMVLLAITITTQTDFYARYFGFAEKKFVVMATFILFLITYLLCLFIIRLFLRPIISFVEDNKNFSELESTPSPSLEKRKLFHDEFEYFNILFSRITECLSKTEAERLFPEIVSESETMRKVLDVVIKVSKSDSPVLIIGETGTGKDLIAEAIHKKSSRSKSPIVRINCSAIPESLFESELFGHEKGAFTSANNLQKGKFESADGGTLFLDEIGELPLSLQPKILRAIETQEIQRIGSSRNIKINVRIVAATNRDLTEMVKQGTFREDLYHRLNVLNIFIPPLRRRKDDIPALIRYFAQKNDFVMDDDEEMNKLMAYRWPGNVREISNLVEKAKVYAENDKHYPLESFLPLNNNQFYDTGEFEINMDDVICPAFFSDQQLDLNIQVASFEKKIIMEALRQSSGIQAKAAKKLGISERSLWYRVKKYEIDLDKIKKQ